MEQLQLDRAKQTALVDEVHVQYMYNMYQHL